VEDELPTRSQLFHVPARLYVFPFAAAIAISSRHRKDVFVVNSSALATLLSEMVIKFLVPCFLTTSFATPLNILILGLVVSTAVFWTS